MKFIRPILLFLFFAAAATLILSLLLPAQQKLERSIAIKAPAAVVYAQLARLENFHRWAVWSREDSSAKYRLSGTDATVGATTTWTGDPAISGEGKIEITALEPSFKVAHRIHFIKPEKRTALSVFTLHENNGTTSLTWNFEMSTPRPWNIFNLFYSMDKEKGKDFENGLAALKKIIEAAQGTATEETYQVETMNFPATRFVMVRQQVKWSDMPSFWQQHFPILYQACQEEAVSAGTASGLYFVWDEKNQQADMAAALPVPAGSTFSSPIVTTLDIAASKAVYVNYYGSYDRLRNAYAAIGTYLSAHHLQQKEPAIEQYISGPGTEKDSTKWVTKIVFLVK